jgi:hypothetical protein
MVIYHSTIMLKPSDHFHGITIINNGSSVTPAPPAAAHLQSSIPSQECPVMQQNAFREGGVQIAELLPKIVSERGEPIVGVIDRLPLILRLRHFLGGVLP